MHDRVLDRAARFASPASLRTREWLLVALSFSSGVYEAICFLTFGKVFTAFQTGNLVFLGVGLAGTRPPAGPNPVSVLVSLAAFAVGAALAMPVLHASGPEADVHETLVWPRRVSVTLGIGLVLQAAFSAVWLTTSPSPGATYVMVALDAAAMGMQMNAIRSLHVPGTSTTAFTAAFISAVSAGVTGALTRDAARRLLGGMAAMALGAALGDWMLHQAHAWAPLVPLLVIATVITVASTRLSPARQALLSRRPGQSLSRP
jgi:uncharacterized membrane protein YoaK (UPF0700 family)